MLAHGQLVDVRDPTFLFLGSGDVLGVPVAVLAAAVLAVGTGLLAFGAATTIPAVWMVFRRNRARMRHGRTFRPPAERMRSC